MNDSELDRLLNAWEAPAPPRGLRERLTESRQQRTAPLRSRLRWLLAMGVAFAALTVAMGQSGDSWADSRLAQAVMAFYEHIVDGIEAHRVTALSRQIMESDPRVFVDGKSAPALVRRHSAVFEVQVPGDSVYWVVFWSKPLSGWARTGQIHGSYIEFEAGAHHVVITCNQRLLISDRAVQVYRRQ
jgi:hypothetical protein